MHSRLLVCPGSELHHLLLQFPYRRTACGALQWHVTCWGTVMHCDVCSRTHSVLSEHLVSASHVDVSGNTAAVSLLSTSRGRARLLPATHLPWRNPFLGGFLALCCCILIPVILLFSEPNLQLLNLKWKVWQELWQFNQTDSEPAAVSLHLFHQERKNSVLLPEEIQAVNWSAGWWCWGRQIL